MCARKGIAAQQGLRDRAFLVRREAPQTCRSILDVDFSPLIGEKNFALTDPVTHRC